jgi:hypothetical protein
MEAPPTAWETGRSEFPGKFEPLNSSQADIDVATGTSKTASLPKAGTTTE